MPRSIVILPTIMLLAAGPADGLRGASMSLGTSSSSRRSMLRDAISSCGCVTSTFLFGPATLAVHAADDAPSLQGGAQEREKLLRLIAAGAAEDEVAIAIADLVPFDPSRGKAARSAALGGTWELLWSAKAEAFSPLLRLPRPLRPDSYQFLGGAAAEAVGEGRVAQMLKGGVLGPKALWLSSGVGAASDDGGVLEIFPPFRFEFGTADPRSDKRTIVEAGSDAEFRKLNARDADAQAAPKNRYLQEYLEETGAGALRISRIISGDPVIVGAVFVHRRV